MSFLKDIPLSESHPTLKKTLKMEEIISRTIADVLVFASTGPGDSCDIRID